MWKATFPTFSQNSTLM